MTLQAMMSQARTLVESLCEDTCSIVDVQSAPDGYGGQTLTKTTIASGIKCLYEAQRDMPAAVTAGTVTSVTRHKIFMIVDADTQTISPDYEIVVAARGDKPELTFEDPRRLDDSYEALLTVSAKLRL